MPSSPLDTQASSKTLERKPPKTRNCWKNARERDRLRSRFLLQDKIASLSSSSSFSSSRCLEPSSAPPSENDSSTTNELFRAIELHQSSNFGISKLTKLPDLNAIHPLRELDLDRMQTLCCSRFGPEFSQSASLFVSSRSHGMTYCAYASLLGQYRVLGCLLSALASPVENASLEVERAVLTFFCGGGLVPLTLYCGIVRSVLEMRIEGVVVMMGGSVCQDETVGLDDGWCCSICSSDEGVSSSSSSSSSSFGLLNWGRPCHHFFCEDCLWKDILRHIHSRDSILCPICQSTRHHNHNNNDDISNHAPQQPTTTTPQQRRDTSLFLFRQLPINSSSLKALPTRKHKPSKNPIHHSWHDAISHRIGRSQDVRHDKFFHYVEQNATRYVRSCLQNGIDIDGRNEYGQTALYIACWYGYESIAKLLLEYGADIQIVPLGGWSNVLSVAMENGREDVVRMLRDVLSHEAIKMLEGQGTLTQRYFSSIDDDYGSFSSSPIIHTLIPKTSAHPGAGAFYVDNAISEYHLSRLEQLWKSLMTVCKRDDDKDPTTTTTTCRTSAITRSYFCDSERFLQRALHYPVSNDTTPILLFFPHVRFLQYLQPGSSLAPHIDLRKVDRFERRSTHTFLLYLTDCEEGGETILLESLQDQCQTRVATVKPRRGRLLIFPHSCPHEGGRVVSVPKVLVRGEVMFE